MPAIASSSSLVELIQTLQEQQQQYAEATAAISQTLADQQRRQQEQAALIAGTLEHISGLLSSLLGGLAPVAPRIAPVEPQIPAAAPKANGSANDGAPKTAAKRRSKGGRGGFAMTGVDAILAFVGDRKNPTSAEINQHWKRQGRGGSADTTLGLLFKSKKLKRTPNPEGRGSRYTLA